MLRSKTNRVVDGLRAGRNADGGWAYYSGKSSRIEPTCWAALYLSRAENAQRNASDSAAHWLASRQRADGLVDDATGGSPNLGFNGLAALYVPRAGSWSVESAKRLLAVLSRTSGVATENTSSRQDNTLKGWSWIEGTFSWIEPTSWCLLALKKSSAALQPLERSARIDEAERMLLDRVCQTGGWNYGNSNVLGQELHAYVPTTALALLALQDRREHPAVQKSLEYLVRERLSEQAGMALALTSICLRVYGVPAADVDERLAAIGERHAFFNNLHIAAMALYSLTAQEHDVEDFRL